MVLSTFGKLEQLILCFTDPGPDHTQAFRLRICHGNCDVFFASSAFSTADHAKRK